MDAKQILYVPKDVDVGVEFAPNAYYEKVLDHYKTMVDGAIERFAEYYASDELEISLDTEKCMI